MQTYLAGRAWRGGQDTVDHMYSEYAAGPAPGPAPGPVSYQNSEPGTSFGSRPGTEAGLPAPHQVVAEFVGIINNE